MKSQWRHLAPVWFCVLSVSFVHAQGLVVNGGFETGDFTGWIQFGNTGITGVDDGTGLGTAPHSGNFQAYFGPLGGLGGISQPLATVPGQTYKIDYWLASLGPGPSEFKLKWGTSTINDLISPAPFGYTEFTHYVVAGGPNVDFGFRHDPSYFLLDDVSVVEVPEPSHCFVQFGAALAVLGTLARRNRK